MSEYIPPEKFTEDVMKKVREAHTIKNRPFLMAERAISSPPVQTLLAFGAACFGILNLVRIYLVLFSPVICR